MWPKILLDLLPHFARLMPAADKYLNPRSASEKAQEAALAALADDVRGPLGQVTEAYAGIGRQLQEQSALVAELSVEVTRARIAAESAEARVATLEKSMTNVILRVQALEAFTPPAPTEASAIFTPGPMVEEMEIFFM